MTPIQDSHVQSLDAIRKRIAIHRGLGLSWRRIAALVEFGGSSAGMLLNIYGGYEPKTDETRKRLGLPPLTIPIEPCPVHNKAHTYNCQTEQVKPIETKPPLYRKATPPSPSDTVSFTVKLTRAQREQINATAKARGITTKDMICSDYLEEMK